MTKLSVNVNKLATLRNTRPHGIPDVARMARIALESGAEGITIHPRPDQRHIRPLDVDAISLVVGDVEGAELNIEGNPFHQMLEFARRVRPTQVTLVPDAVEAVTSDHGWDLENDGARLVPLIAELKGLGCRVSLFLDADPLPMARAAELGADRIELYTEPFASEFARGRGSESIRRYAEAAHAAHEQGLGINAGHDLNLDNLGPFLRGVPHVLEVSIGHALIADALEFGLRETVGKYLACCRTAAKTSEPLATAGCVDAN